jgi:SAM-dependent methyltransferase
LSGHFLRLKRAFDLCEATGAKVLDAGCGYGQNAIWAALLGANRVVAVDFEDDHAKMLPTLERLADLFGVADRVEAVSASILDLPFADQTFDAMFNFEVLEHVEDLSDFFREIHRILRPGGRAYSRTGANGASPIRLWQAKGWHDGFERATFAPRRRVIIAERFPDLDDATLDDLVARTRGCARDQILRRAEEILDGQRVDSSRFAPAIDPDTGQWAERQVGPFEVARAMRAAGFKARMLRPRFFITGRGRQRMIANAMGLALTAAHPMSLPLTPGIEIFGVKSLQR